MSCIFILKQDKLFVRVKPADWNPQSKVGTIPRPSTIRLASSKIASGGKFLHSCAILQVRALSQVNIHLTSFVLIQAAVKVLDCPSASVSLLYS